MNFYLPHTLNELWEIFAKSPDSCVYSGGTDFLVKARIKGSMPKSVICIERINEISGIKEFSNEIFIGAGTTHTTIISNPVIKQHCSVLAQACAQLGSPQIRNMGTIGGNIVSASPAGDTLPPLYVLESEVEIRNSRGKRRMPITEFIQGPGKTALEPCEILYGIWIQKHPLFNIHHFEKVGKRKALAIAVVSMAACINLSEHRVVNNIKFAWGSAGPTVMTIPKVEKYLVGVSIDDISRLKQAAEYVMDNVTPIDDVRASASYRKKTAGNLLLRLAGLDAQKNTHEQNKGVADASRKS